MKKFNIAIVFSANRSIRSAKNHNLCIDTPEITENRNAGIPLCRDIEMPRYRNAGIPKCRHPDKAKKNYVGENCCTLK